MLIRPIINRLNESTVLKTVRFVRELPELERFSPDQLPAVYMLPSSTRGAPDNGDLSLIQENVEVYSFCLVTSAPEPQGDDEPLADALDELRRSLFGFQLSPSHAPLVIGEGDLIDFNSRVNAWVETFITRRTFRT